MTTAFKSLLESAKFWTLILGLLATLLAKYGVHVDDSTAQLIAGGFAMLLGAQALTDHGKAAAAINAKSTADSDASWQAHEQVIAANDNGPTLPEARTVQAGFAQIGAALFIALFAMVFGLMSMTTSCKTTGPLPAPISDIIDCTKYEATTQWPALVTKLEPDVAAHDWLKLVVDVEAAVVTDGAEIARCVGEELIAQYLSTKQADGSNTWTAHDASDKLRSNAAGSSGHVITFHTKLGDL